MFFAPRMRRPTACVAGSISRLRAPPEQMSEQENGAAAEPRDEELAPPAPVVDAGADDEAREQAAPVAASDEATALRERHLRLAAEFDNYRKRVERERTESWVRAQAQLLERLLEPLDDLERIAHQDGATTSVAALQEGAAMVQKKFFRHLDAIGVEEIEAEGRPFDPTIHEALTTVPAEGDEDDDTVAQVYQKGYLLKGVLLRPARVVVRKRG